VSLPPVSGSVLSAYEQAISRVDKARAALSAPFIGADVVRAMGAAGAVANALLNRGGGLPPKPVPGLAALTNKGVIRQVHYGRIERLTQQVRALSLSWANLWSVEITEARSGKGALSTQAGERLELLAESVSFGSRTLSGETIPVGSAAIDRRGVAQGTSIRITTRDDADGTLQQWFEGKCDQVAHPDGTFGYPKDYLLLIRVTRLKRDPKALDGELLNGFSREFLVSAASCEEEYARSENQLQTVNLTFEPSNTFDPVNLVAK
jgi:hypothetical protein